ncbi:MAG: nucleoside hydrolase [Anaerolineaceae bacterium]|nr:nucleoside hydrolase [Anaerolineaceae bacterium]
MRKFWIDTDTASDDAVAILMALQWPDVEVVGISIVAGNMPVNIGSENARYTVELCGAETPVYEGAVRPLLREPYWAYFFHGPDGMGGKNYPKPKRPAEKTHAVEAMINAFRAHPGEITLITLGPLTNIATALSIAPDLAEKIPMCYCMGGAAATLGNVTPTAEYNIWFDPEAAQMAFHGGFPFMMVGWEHCRGRANLDDNEIAYVRSFNNPLADFTIDCNEHAIKTNQEWLSEPGLALPDPVTMAVALDPSVCTKSGKHRVDVVVDSEITRGMTVVDQLGVTNQEPNIEVCWEIDIDKWKETLYKTIK